MLRRAVIFWPWLAATRLLPILILFGWLVAAVQAQEDDFVEGATYSPTCLDIRAANHECVRDKPGSSWRCSDEPHLDLRNFGFGICLTDVKDTRPVCACGKQCGPKFRQLPYITTTDPSTGVTKTLCDFDTLKPEPETVPELPSKYAQAESFTLPKEKFPQCLAARIQTHECLRSSEDGDWKCDRRTTLSEPTAVCLVWANLDHPCKTDRGWPIIRYVNVNIDHGLSHGRASASLPIQKLRGSPSRGGSGPRR